MLRTPVPGVPDNLTRALSEVVGDLAWAWEHLLDLSKGLDPEFHSRWLGRSLRNGRHLLEELQQELTDWERTQSELGRELLQVESEVIQWVFCALRYILGARISYLQFKHEHASIDECRRHVKKCHEIMETLPVILAQVEKCRGATVFRDFRRTHETNRLMAREDLALDPVGDRLQCAIECLDRARHLDRVPDINASMPPGSKQNIVDSLAVPYRKVNELTALWMEGKRPMKECESAAILPGEHPLDVLVSRTVFHSVDPLVRRHLSISKERIRMALDRARDLRDYDFGESTGAQSQRREMTTDIEIARAHLKRVSEIVGYGEPEQDANGG